MNHAQRRQRHILRRAGIRRSPGPSWRVRGRRRAAGRRFFGTCAARPRFYPYQFHSPASTGTQRAAPAGEMGVHQARRDAATAHTAVRRPILSGGSGCEDLRGDGRRTAPAGLRGPAPAAHRAGTGDGAAACPPWTAAEGADHSDCRNAPHLRGSCCWGGLSVAVLHSIVIV